MKSTFFQFQLFISKFNKTHLQFVLMLLALGMLVLGAGAPEDIGGIGK
jgi:hypothetical protein